MKGVKQRNDMFLFRLGKYSSSGQLNRMQGVFRSFCSLGDRSRFLHGIVMVRLPRMDTPEKSLGIKTIRIGD